MLGGLTGGLVAYYTRDVVWSFGPTNAAGDALYFYWRNWHINFILSVVARVTGLVLVLRIVDPGSRSPGDMLAHGGRRLVRSFRAGVFFPMTAFSPFLRNRNDRHKEDK